MKTIVIFKKNSLSDSGLQIAGYGWENKKKAEERAKQLSKYGEEDFQLRKKYKTGNMCKSIYFVREIDLPEINYNDIN